MHIVKFTSLPSNGATISSHICTMNRARPSVCNTVQVAMRNFDTYYFEKNLQGDIIAVYNESGTRLVSYTYDAWDNHTICFL